MRVSHHVPHKTAALDARCVYCRSLNRVTPSPFSSGKGHADASGSTELFRYPVPHGGIDIEPDMAA